MGALAACVLCARPAYAQDGLIVEGGKLDVQALLEAGGVIGWIIIALSVAMLALIVEHLLSIRRGSLMPGKLAEEAHQLIAAGQYQPAEALCRQQPSFLGFVVASGLQEVGLGYSAVEKAMEDASAEQAARLFRKIEYLSVIATLAPMLGLMGTVWGMILAFAQFAEKANPQPSELAPAISLALVTTLDGLVVAVPALAVFAMFRNRIDELVAETSLMAEHVISPLKLALAEKRRSAREAKQAVGDKGAARPSVPPSAAQREPPR